LPGTAGYPDNADLQKSAFRKGSCLDDFRSRGEWLHEIVQVSNSGHIGPSNCILCCLEYAFPKGCQEMRESTYRNPSLLLFGGGQILPKHVCQW